MQLQSDYFLLLHDCEYVNKAGYSCKLGVRYIHTLNARHHSYTLRVMPIISFVLSKLDIVCLFHFLQASGPSLPLLALDPLPVQPSPSLQLVTTLQCCLEEGNLVAESMTATS